MSKLQELIQGAKCSCSLFSMDPECPIHTKADQAAAILRTELHELLQVARRFLGCEGVLEHLAVEQHYWIDMRNAQTIQEAEDIHCFRVLDDVAMSVDTQTEFPPTAAEIDAVFDAEATFALKASE